MGRPSGFSQDLADHICEKIVLGWSLRKICEPENMPSIATIFNWLRTEPLFLENYMRAREHQADTFADEMADIADNPTGDVQRDRLRVDTRKWITSKLKPKKYGDKVDVEHSGSVGVTFTTVYEKGEDKD